MTTSRSNYLGNVDLVRPIGTPVVSSLNSRGLNRKETLQREKLHDSETFTANFVGSDKLRTFSVHISISVVLVASLAQLSTISSAMAPGIISLEWCLW